MKTFKVILASALLLLSFVVEMNSTELVAQKGWICRGPAWQTATGLLVEWAGVEWTNAAGERCITVSIWCYGIDVCCCAEIRDNVLVIFDGDSEGKMARGEGTQADSTLYIVDGIDVVEP